MSKEKTKKETYNAGNPIYVSNLTLISDLKKRLNDEKEKNKELEEKLQKQYLDELSNMGQLMDQLEEKNKETKRFKIIGEIMVDIITEDLRKYDEKKMDYIEPKKEAVELEINNFIDYLYNFYKKMK